MSTDTLQPIDFGALTKRGVTAYVPALAVNLVLAWTLLRFELVGSTEFLQYPPIVLWTTVGVVGATIVYGVLTRRSEAPEETFVRIAVAVLLLSFLPDIGLALFVDSVTASEAIGLMTLHVPPAVACIVLIPGRITARR